MAFFSSILKKDTLFERDATRETMALVWHQGAARCGHAGMSGAENVAVAVGNVMVASFRGARTHQTVTQNKKALPSLTIMTTAKQQR